MNKTVVLNRLFSLRGYLLQRSLQAGLRNLSTGKTLRKNQYEILGVGKDATQAEIKNAYFELSKIYHPDKISGTDENIAKFREITTAYEILGNEQSRRLYDKGLFGEKKLGIEEPLDLKDPIVKFYKQKQVRDQAKSQEDMETWAREFTKKVKRTYTRKNEFYRATKQAESKESDYYRDMIFGFCAMFIATFILLIGYEDTKANEIFNLLRNI